MNSGHVCSVPGCTNKQKPMFRFPNPKRGLDLCYRWRQAINNPKWENVTNEHLNRTARVCSKHFLDSELDSTTRLCLINRLLVPSVNLPTDRSLELEQSPPSEVGQKRVTHVIKGAPLFSLDREVKRVVYACKFPLCKSAAYRNYRFNKRFFKFPRDQERQQVWRTICNIEPHVRCEDFRVCEDHFEASDFLGSRLLLPFAVPKAVVLNDNGEQVKMSVGPSYNRGMLSGKSGPICIFLPFVLNKYY
ncbi:hypothetical protein TcasGA2_TC033496 [Tribolium castaneum]|uniref:THAP-type domain-containing protein n=1 Tax=Tribolium castaneum TaxID=7070 RepID=A0A139WDN2_TRICA|nr:hypothetical protein TcasGA2_TC033496 [Tribolium castaneum]